MPPIDDLSPGPANTPAAPEVTAPAEGGASATPAAPAAPSFTPHTETPSILGTAAVAPAGDIEAPKPADGAQPASGNATEPEQPKPGEPAAPEAPKPGEEPKPGEAAKPGDAPTTEGAAETLEPIVYPEWTAPEGVTLDKAAIAQFNEFLGQHRLAPEIGQELLNRHTAAMKQFAEHTIAEQHRVFGEMRAEWRNQIMADPIIGGSRHQTAMGAVARFRDRFVSDHPPESPEYKADVQALNDMLLVTGVGDHPILLRMLHRAAQFFDEPRLPPVNNGPAPNGGMPKKKGMAGIYKQPPGGR
jgi:hypothetical protein